MSQKMMNINIELKEIERLLLIQIRPFGDVLLNTPYLPVLRQKLPHAKIDFLVRQPYQSVLRSNPYIDEIVQFRKRRGVMDVVEKFRLILSVRRRRYDLIVDQIQGATSAQIVALSNSKYRICFHDARWRRFYNCHVRAEKDRYSADLKFEMLAPLGIAPPLIGNAPAKNVYSFFYHVESESRSYIRKWLSSQGLSPKKWVLISPGSPRIRKKWLAENYAVLADLLIQKANRPVVLLWGPGEEADVHRVADKMKQTPIIAPPTSYNQAAALLETCELLICNDGGLNHLAVAIGAQTLAIFGPTNPKNWAPDHVAGYAHLKSDTPISNGDNSFGVHPVDAFEKAFALLDQAPA
jgi:ADP-heptose:LPS heptosyltransferase